MSEATHSSPMFQRVDAHSWGRSVLDCVRPLAAQKEVEIFSEIDRSIHELAIEKEPMSELVEALLHSAILTSPAGGSVGLEMSADGGHDTVHLTIWDSGPGVQTEDVLRLFLGEGLENQSENILKTLPELVFKHEGLMTVNSSAGYGTRVTLSLPWRDTLENQPHTASATAGRHILLVDDDELNIFTISSYLRSLGFEVTTAYNGWDGVKKVIVSRPDVILMDVDMPIMNGIEAIRQIRALGEDGLAQVPVLVLSAYSMSSDQNDCLAAGADEFISKPVSMRWLRNKLQQYLV